MSSTWSNELPKINTGWGAKSLSPLKQCNNHCHYYWYYYDDDEHYYYYCYSSISSEASHHKALLNKNTLGKSFEFWNIVQ